MVAVHAESRHIPADNARKHPRNNTRSIEDNNNPTVSHGKQHFTSLFYAAIWAAWLLTGTLFYAYAPESNLGFVKGFYMAVNVGYSIGWGFPAEPYPKYLWFSSVFVIFGSSLVALALGFFAGQIIADADNWFTNMIQQQEYEESVATDQPMMKRIWAFLRYRKDALRGVGVWFLWIALMTLYSKISIGWTFAEAQYYAISSLSTGGLYPIPNDSPTYLFGVTGIFSATGVPIMAVAMASVATLFIDQGNLDGVKESIQAEVTMEELHMLYKFGFEDGDSQIDRAEYIILCMVRMGTDPRAIKFASEQFKLLDSDKSGTLSIAEITNGKITSMLDLSVGTDQVSTTEDSEASPQSINDHPTALASLNSEASHQAVTDQPTALSSMNELEFVC